MTRLKQEELVYRFSSFAARGTITLRPDCIHVKTRTHLGWWEQTIPLSDVKPHYGTLSAIPQLYIWTWIFAIIFLGLGIYGLIWGAWATKQTLLSVLLLAFGQFLAWYLVKYRKSEWILFSMHDDYGRFGYTRQGPDADKCDLFTSKLVDAIRRSRQEQSHSLPPHSERQIEVNDQPPTLTER